MGRKSGKALVVGAGISGVRSALDLAEAGYGVTLIDRAPHLGGVLSQLDFQFPTNHCGMCQMLPSFGRDSSSQHCLRKGLYHENIEILLSTEMIAMEGEPGHYHVKLRQKPQWIDPQRCIGCGLCEDVCPVSVPDEFNAGMGTRKAVSLPSPHVVPNAYVIDLSACTRCGACEAACPTGAVRLSLQEREKFNILVVDDEPIVRDSLRDWLAEEEGFHVETAGSGPEGLERLEQKAFALVLLDIKMPGMDGVEVLERIRAAGVDTDVIMMTAYATVETAVSAMKTGALDYILKPFDPEALIPKVLSVYERFEAESAREIDVGAVVLAGGTAFFDPADLSSVYGYGRLANVVTNLEFERILSGSGPMGGRLRRPGDDRPVEKIAWIQCVGSRDLQLQSPFCSNVCCMIAVKEAMLAKEKAAGSLDAAIFYMDMRTFGKSYQRYRDRAEQEMGVRFERRRVHTIEPVDAADSRGGLLLRTVDETGQPVSEPFDMVVLSNGQRPAVGSREIAEMMDIPMNSWGFAETLPFSLTQTRREGVVLGGSFSGLKDIGDSVIQASAAAAAASRVIHKAGGGLSAEPPRILAAVCTCGGKMLGAEEFSADRGRILRNPDVIGVEAVPRLCTKEGMDALGEMTRRFRPNRILLGACLPMKHPQRFRKFLDETELESTMVEVVDVMTPITGPGEADRAASPVADAGGWIRAVESGIAALRWADPAPVPSVPVARKALVVGGGIAGMSAALLIAEHGYPVELVEAGDRLGGNLRWIRTVLDGTSPESLLETTIQQVEKHPHVNVHLNAEVTDGGGRAGRFRSIVETAAGEPVTLEHGVVILATGGGEATTSAYACGEHPDVITQRQFETGLAEGGIPAERLQSVVMIQCVDCREPPRNYCSRVCCGTTLKHALLLKDRNPSTSVVVAYRDMMSYGFMEAYYTEARRRGVLFVSYRPDKKPRVQATGGKPTVTVWEPILERELEIEADLVVLATGIVPNLPPALAQIYGAQIDGDGFFQEAEWKWRPVDARNEGVFACGLAHSPRSIPEAIGTAEAAAQRALRIIQQDRLPAGTVLAKVRERLCSLCEQCIAACPFEARALDPEAEKIIVDPIRCQGCGCCAVACPNGASYLEGFTGRQMLETIDAQLHAVPIRSVSPL